LLPTAKFLNARMQVLSKSDKLAKTVVCFQILWLVLQTIARRIDGLPITLLELNTIAQIWVTLVLYVLWWYKPQGIADNIDIDFTNCIKCQEYLREAQVVWQRVHLPLTNAGTPFLLVDLALVMGVYIAIDALGCNAYFPTDAERILWIGSVCVFAVGTILILGFMWLKPSWDSTIYSSGL
jgi:hypothetical protein